MSLEVRIKPVESLLFCSELVAVGKFRCHVSHPLFRDSGPCSNHTFVFPRTSTRIEHESGASFTGGPNTVSIYNEGQRYVRTAVDEADVSDWYAVSDEIARDAIATFDSHVIDRPNRRFRQAAAPAPDTLYLKQRALFQRLESGEAVDRIAVEEEVMALLASVLESAYRMEARQAKDARDGVEDVKRAIAAMPCANPPLRELAAIAASSPYQLCRNFRAVTAMTITRYRHALRLRIALDRLPDCDDLTDLALDLGYSSHSHFTRAFRDHFGVTPSRYRATM
ncbi:MAG TPA: AraC family transcriptional regulator [Thermoanaerobaculia bacterium]|nr:AraC family transcriptional regulator [Thermoanaerobaculia bacterium]